MKKARLVETTMYRGFTLKIRKGPDGWITEIIYPNGEHFCDTALCTSRTAAANEAAKLINQTM